MSVGLISGASAWWRTAIAARGGSHGGEAGRVGSMPRRPLVTVRPAGAVPGGARGGWPDGGRGAGWWPRRRGGPGGVDASEALGDGEAGGAGAEGGAVELAGFQGFPGSVELVEGDGGADLTEEAATVDDLAGGDVDLGGGLRGGGRLAAPGAGAVG